MDGRPNEQVSPVAAAADAIRSALDNGREPAAFRRIIHLADHLATLAPGDRVAATMAPPPSTGSLRYDALLAGIVEIRLEETGTAPPEWAARANVLSDYWFVDPITAGTARVIDATPPALRRRRVILHAAELVSV